jgi:hypothetical protein
MARQVWGSSQDCAKRFLMGSDANLQHWLETFRLLAHPLRIAISRRVETLRTHGRAPIPPGDADLAGAWTARFVPLPSKWSLEFGPAVSTAHLGREATRDELLVSRMTEELRR